MRREGANVVVMVLTAAALAAIAVTIFVDPLLGALWG
jgi:hypothetical protein